MPTAKQFCNLLMQAVNEKWGYVWSLEGETYTPALADKFVKVKRSPPNGHTLNNYWKGKDWAARWYGRHCADCSGLIIWALRELNIFNSKQDMNSTSLISVCTKQGNIQSNMPLDDGLILWRKGHIAVLCNGKVLEAKGTKSGVVYGRSKINDFTKWGYLPYLHYESKTALSEKPYAAICSGNSVNVRSEANTNAAILGKFDQNDPLIALNFSLDWAKITGIKNGTFLIGYLHRKYIQKL